MNKRLCSIVLMASMSISLVSGTCYSVKADELKSSREITNTLEVLKPLEGENITKDVLEIKTSYLFAGVEVNDVIAQVEGRSVKLERTPDYEWVGSINLEGLSTGEKQVEIIATDIEGKETKVVRNIKYKINSGEPQLNIISPQSNKG